MINPFYQVNLDNVVNEAIKNNKIVYRICLFRYLEALKFKNRIYRPGANISLNGEPEYLCRIILIAKVP